MKSTPARPVGEVDGRPELVLPDEERESIAELVAELLLEALRTDAPTEAAR